ncbi:MAG: hypothetical protein WC358_03820 [Ignavibacteria bacterium]|jgi:hypothetical protein
MPNNLLFILGAGASAEAGIPTMNQFLDKTDEIIQKQSLKGVTDEVLKESLEKVIEIKEYLGKIYHKSTINLDNIEHLYGCLEMGKILGGIGNLSKKDIQNYIGYLDNVVIKTIEESMILGTDIYHPQAPIPYFNFISVLKNIYEKKITTNITIIDFNYDIAFEIAHNIFAEKNAPVRNYDYCLNGKNLDFDTIKLLKIHGSLNWGIKRDNSIFIYGIKDYRTHYSTLIRHNELNENTIPIASDMKINNAIESIERIAIIPPSFNKNFKFTQLQNVWKEAAKQLSIADKIYISGFSLNNADNFFRYLFSIGTINNNNLKKIVVYNYNLDDDTNNEMKKRFDDLIGGGFKNRFLYKNNKFSDMINELEDGVTNHEPKITFIH